jgi:hypothetical protein
MKKSFKKIINFDRFHSTNTIPKAERILNLIKQNKNSQFTSTKEKLTNRDDKLINSTIVPYYLFEKKIFEYNIDENQSSPLKNYELIFCFNKTSEHIVNIENESKIANCSIGNFYFKLGLQCPNSKHFVDTGLFPPRSVNSYLKKVFNLEIEFLDPKKNIFEIAW